VAGQICKNTHKRPNKIFAAKPLLKTAKFSQYDRKRPSSQHCWSIFCPFKWNSGGVLYFCVGCVQFCICVVDYGPHMGRLNVVPNEALISNFCVLAPSARLTTETSCRNKNCEADTQGTEPQMFLHSILCLVGY